MYKMSVIIECRADIENHANDKTVKVMQITGIEKPEYLTKIPDRIAIELYERTLNTLVSWANILSGRKNVTCVAISAEHTSMFPENVHFGTIHGFTNMSPDRYDYIEIECRQEVGNFTQTKLIKNLAIADECSGNCQILDHLACFENIDRLVFKRNTCFNSIPAAEFDRLGVKKVTISATAGVVCIDNVLNSTTVKSLGLSITNPACCTYSSDNETITELRLHGFEDKTLQDMCNRNNYYNYNSRLTRVKPIMSEQF